MGGILALKGLSFCSLNGVAISPMGVGVSVTQVPGNDGRKGLGWLGSGGGCELESAAVFSSRTA